MSGDTDTTTIDVSEAGINACKRIDASMAALDRAITAVEKSAKPEDRAKVKAAEALKPPEPAAAHQTNKDHEDSFFKNLAQAALFKKLSGEDAHGFIDEEYDAKYSAPLEKKLKYAKALGISQVHDKDGKPIQMNDLARDTRRDIDLAKATASLIAEGHTKLEIPKHESVGADVRRGAQFIDAIIECANQARRGEKPDYAVKPDAETYKPPILPMPLHRISAKATRSGLKELHTTVNVMELPEEELQEPEDDQVKPNQPTRRMSSNAKLLGAFNPFVVPAIPVPGGRGLNL